MEKKALSCDHQFLNFLIVIALIQECVDLSSRIVEYSLGRPHYP